MDIISFKSKFELTSSQKELQEKKLLEQISVCNNKCKNKLSDTSSIKEYTGAILYELNPYGCRELSFNFRRWVEVFNLQHALWIPAVNEAGKQNDICQREDSVTVNVKDIIDEVKNLLKNELAYRSGYIKRALDIMNDMSVIDHPPSKYKNILS
ncbi:unnamed protein product [Adineta steineri]|uniref:Uncharacterized protein n=1 Tax=Adineta steineri TaxID=433720 RepID=A0A819ZL99_9BILA|nr:unnamed protein product [Adineta steineri]CAF4178970.1 unnamed protein product [Adineta steineri]